MIQPPSATQIAQLGRIAAHQGVSANALAAMLRALGCHGLRLDIGLRAREQRLAEIAARKVEA